MADAPSIEDLRKQYNQTPKAARDYAGTMTQGAIGDIQAMGAIPSMKDMSQIYQDSLKSKLGIQAEAEKQAEQRSHFSPEDLKSIGNTSVALDTLHQLSQGWDAAHQQSGGTWGNPWGAAYNAGYGKVAEGLKEIPVVGGLASGIMSGAGDFAQQAYKGNLPAVTGYEAFSGNAKAVLNAGVEQEGKASMGSKYNQMVEKLPDGTDSPESKTWKINNTTQILKDRLEAMEGEFLINKKPLNDMYDKFPNLMQLKTWQNPNLSKVNSTQPTATGGTVGSGISPEGNALLYQGAKPKATATPSPAQQAASPTTSSATAAPSNDDWITKIFST